ncbi:hypothetical protein [Pedobacter nutrimenti]|uniref:hypothetical protein n=1 Tax=Pedobacter nutrimenti TaxID=1241337 RepID=UPI00292CED7D|nr:hypothetical protein [Pedobacter nutrimenti]
MKYIITLFLVFFTLFSFSQTIRYRIQGKVKDTSEVNFVYLASLPKKLPSTTLEIFKVVSIKNGEFEFNGSCNLDEDLFKYGILFMDKRPNVTDKEVLSKLSNLIWVAGREDNLKRILFEDMQLQIENSDRMRTSTIVDGGILTRQKDELAKIYTDGNKQLVEFIRKYPDSPLSLDALALLTEIINIKNKDRLENKAGMPPNEMYNLLSDRLKKSKNGISLKTELKTKYP